MIPQMQPPNNVFNFCGTHQKLPAFNPSTYSAKEYQWNQWHGKQCNNPTWEIKAHTSTAHSADKNYENFWTSWNK